MKWTAISCVLALLSIPAWAGVDLSGKWSGSINLTNAEGNTNLEDVYMVLKTSGNEVTGTAGPDRDRQWPIVNGRLEGTKITFETKDPDNGHLWKVQLLYTEKRLKGEAWSEVEGRKTGGKLDLTRQPE
ncbi:MAG TPA: hypothetical protein VE398_17300 [Acidobacteriota bacterium]|nr:hypothetical protein [Acidobacteriota bacterium]